MAFKHGTSASEVPSKVRGMTTVETPVVCIGTAPINMGDITNVNKAQIIHNATDAQKFFGGTNKIEGYTISEFLNAAFNVIKTTPVICINVLDPTKHKKPVAASDIEITKDGTVVLPIGVLAKTIVIKTIPATTTPATPAADIPFSGYFESDGTYVIVPDTKLADGSSVNVAYDTLDPSMVTDDDIIGSIDPTTLARKGMECINDIFNNYSMIPLVTITPGFTGDEVRAALDTKTSKINNKWGSMSFIDIPEITKYGEAIKFKKEHNWIDSDQVIFYGRAKLGEKIYWQSILAALLFAQTTGNNDGVPYESPSNLNIKASGICYKDGTEYKDVSLDEEQANMLNASGITTILKRPNGTVLWGNRTSVYQPGGETDPKETFIPYKAMMKFVANTLMINSEASVDRPMTSSRAESIKTNINLWLNGLVNSQKLYGGRVEFIKDENPDMIEGKFVWHIYLGMVTPGESLHYILEFDSQYAELKLFS